MKEMTFKSQKELHEWFLRNHHHEPIWIIFDKRNVKDKLTQEQALDEALCFGWIDGLVKRIDDYFFKKYFAMRREKSIWSTKNKRSIERLIKDNRMTEHGYRIINIAKENGCYKQGDRDPDDFSLEAFDQLISFYPKAYVFYNSLSLSLRKAYAMHYFTAKKQETRQRRLTDIVKRLEDGLKPME